MGWIGFSIFERSIIIVFKPLHSLLQKSEGYSLPPPKFCHFLEKRIGKFLEFFFPSTVNFSLLFLFLKTFPSFLYHKNEKEKSWWGGRGKFEPKLLWLWNTLSVGNFSSYYLAGRPPVLVHPVQCCSKKCNACLQVHYEMVSQFMTREMYKVVVFVWWLCV